MIPYGRQHVSQADIDAVIKVLQSDFLTQGPAIPQFESAVAEKCGARFAVAVNSATSALHIACAALGLGPGDILWTVPNTFVASANCGRYCGADVDFVDIDPESWDISVGALRSKLLRAKADGKLPKILVPVHFGGQPTEQAAIWALSREFGFRVVEDASHAIGAVNQGETVGNCHWSDVTVFSFHPVKIITTAEGGLALTNDKEIAWRMSMLRSHGITRDPERMTATPQGPWHYEQLELGYNYRLTDIQASLGLSQLAQLNTFVARRNELAQNYHTLLRSLPVRSQVIRSGATSSYHLYAIRIQAKDLSTTHAKVFNALRQNGVGVNLHYTPVHLQPYYRQLGFGPGQFPEAENYAREAITLPLFPDLSEADQEKIVSILASALR